MRDAFSDCPICPHYKDDGYCPCVRTNELHPWWSRWAFTRFVRALWSVLRGRA